MFDHEIKAYAARVAFVSKIPRQEMTEEEKMVIESCYHHNESVIDCAYMLESNRILLAGGVVYVEDEICE
jgi:hypothetical protein